MSTEKTNDDDFDFDAVMNPAYEPTSPTVGVRTLRAYKGRANLAASRALFESDAASADRENGRAW